MKSDSTLPTHLRNAGTTSRAKTQKVSQFMPAEPGPPSGLRFNSHVFRKCQKAFNHSNKLKCTADVRIFSVHSYPYIPEYRNFKLLYSRFILGTMPWKRKKLLQVFSNTMPPADRSVHSNTTSISPLFLKDFSHY